MIEYVCVPKTIFTKTDTWTVGYSFIQIKKLGEKEEENINYTGGKRKEIEIKVKRKTLRKSTKQNFLL